VFTIVSTGVMVPPHGVEPRTYWLQINCSCRLLRWQRYVISHNNSNSKYL